MEAMKCQLKTYLLALMSNTCIVNTKSYLIISYYVLIEVLSFVSSSQTYTLLTTAFSISDNFLSEKKLVVLPQNSAIHQSCPNEEVNQHFFSNVCPFNKDFC